MFTEITWAMYLKIVAAALFIYYTFLLLKFYYPQVSASLPTGGAPFRNSHSATAYTATAGGGEKTNLTPTGEFNEPGYNDYEIIEEMAERVKAALKEAVDSNPTEEHLISNLKLIVNDYPVLAKSSFRPSINQFIATESQQHGFAFIKEDTVEQLWRTI